MASFIDEMTVNTAITDSTKLDLGHVHITTADFMQLNPILCKEMVPGERCDVNLMTFAKMQPLAVPTMGRANIKERSFFVPMRTIWRPWNDWITDTPHVYSGAKTAGVMFPQVPVIENRVLASFFLAQNVVLTGTNYVVATDVTSSQGTSDPEPYDIKGYYGNNTVYMRLTREGKQCLKILESLGYKVVFDDRNNDSYSALPLMAYAKVYLDWYFPNQYVNTDIYVNIMGLLNYDGANPIYFTITDLCNIFGWATYVNYDSDYFVNAWDNPVAPSTGVYSNFTITDITVTEPSSTYGNSSGFYAPYSSTTNNITGLGVSNDSNIYGTPTSVMRVDAGSSGGPRLGMSVSDYQHTALKALTDYMKRHQLVGAKAMDRYLARFGKKLNSEQLNRCNYIGSKMVPLQIGEVTSTSPSSDVGSVVSGLGKFAGKGMAYEKNFSFDWSTDEYGYLIVLSSIVPAAGIWQGINRHVRHLSKSDFWTPEFDNLGVQAISMRELYNNYDYSNLSDASSAYMSFNDNVFGFAPRYGEYKYMNDQLTGDFVCQSLIPVDNTAKDSAWHLMRTFDDRNFRISGVYDYKNMPHSRMFMQGIRDHSQYDRIFTYHEDVYGPDSFTVIYDFQMVSFAPMKPLYETYDFEDKGRKVREEAGGVKVN